MKRGKNYETTDKMLEATKRNYGNLIMNILLLKEYKMVH